MATDLITDTLPDVQSTADQGVYVTGLEPTQTNREPLPKPYERPELANSSQNLFYEALKISLTQDFKLQHRNAPAQDIWSEEGSKLTIGEGENAQDWRIKIDPKKQDLELELQTGPNNSQTLKVSHFPDMKGYPDSEITFTEVSDIETGDGKVEKIETTFRNDQKAEAMGRELLRKLAQAVTYRPPLASLASQLPAIK